MEYMFYSIATICLSVLAYQLIDKKVQKQKDPDELIELRVQNEALDEHVDFYKDEAKARESELRVLQNKFIEIIEAKK